jgi:hypothetical protein
MSKCNCENKHCPHGEEACKNEASEKRAMYVGKICNECVKKMPKEYMLDEKKEHKKSDMKLSDKLLLVAGWLESEENDLLVSAERNEKSLEVVAAALVQAAEMLYVGAEEIEKTESKEIGLTADKLDEMAAVAAAFDESGDELLQKQASVLDEILLTLAAPKNAVAEAKKATDDRIEQLRKDYHDTKKNQDEMNKVSDTLDKVEKSQTYKKYRVLQHELDTRYCPDHAGVSAVRVGERRVQCPLDGKIYDYTAGYNTLDGNKVPGGDVSEQTKVMQHNQGEVIFDTRNQRLGIE